MNVLWGEEGLSLGEFARRAEIGKAAATAMIKRLEGMGLVVTGPHPGDARLNVIKVTPIARELAPEVRGILDDMEKKIREAIGEEDLKIMLRGLSAICKLDLKSD